MKENFDESPVIIIGIPSNTEMPEGLDSANAGLNLSSLLVIHKTLTRFAIDWELGTCEGEKIWINQDIKTEESKEFYRNILGKITSPANIDEIKPNQYRGLIVPSISGFMGTYKSQKISNKLSMIIKQLFLESKCAIFSGYGIASSFECRDINHFWTFSSYNICSLSLIQQSNDESFPFVPYIIEDRIRELGGNFCWNDRSAELLVLDRKLITIQDDLSMKAACNIFGYILSDI